MMETESVTSDPNKDSLSQSEELVENAEHAHNSEPINSCEDSKPLVCGLCCEKFNNFVVYCSHLKTHQTEDKLWHDCLDTGGNQHTCKSCGAWFPSLCLLESHLVDIEKTSDFLIIGRTKEAYMYSSDVFDKVENFLRELFEGIGTKGAFSEQDVIDKSHISNKTKMQAVKSKHACNCKPVKPVKSKCVKSKVPKDTTGKGKGKVNAKSKRKHRLKNQCGDKTKGGNFQEVKVETIFDLKESDINAASESTTSDLKVERTWETSFVKVEKELQRSDLDETKDSDTETVDLDCSFDLSETVSETREEDECKTVSRNVASIDDLDGKNQRKISKNNLKGARCVQEDSKFHLDETVEKIIQRLKKRGRGFTLLSCETCGRVLPKQFMHNHTKSHQEKKLPVVRLGKTRVPCEVCGALVQRRFMSSHSRTHGPAEHKCDICGVAFCLYGKLTNHKKQVHAKEANFTCDKCGKAFKARPYLKQHSLTHREIADQACPMCPKKFTTKALLKCHLATHSAEKPYICEVCGRCFSRPGERNRHKKIVHSDFTPYSCSVCGKCFKTPKDIKRHEKIHKPPEYFCTLCGKGFAQKNNMKTHMQSYCSKRKTVMVVTGKSMC